MERVFNKLVRDNIPNIIANNGEESVTRVLEEDEYRTELYKKLLEEANEVISSKTSDETIEELADVLEILKSMNIPITSIGKIKEILETDKFIVDEDSLEEYIPSAVSYSKKQDLLFDLNQLLIPEYILDYLYFDTEYYHIVAK